MFLQSLRVFVPLSILLALLQVHPAMVFVCACVAIVPLADLLAEFTERLSEYQGRTMGGLLNSMLGVMAVVVMSPVIRERESSWIEGAMLVAVYFVFSIGFFFLGPSSDDERPAAASVSTAPFRLREP